MKVLATLVLLFGAMLVSTGCGTPALTERERMAIIGRNMAWEGSQIEDDIDYALLLRPRSHLTSWHVR